MDVLNNYVEIVRGPRGPKARIAGSRIRVQDIIIWHEKLGMSADEIATEYPQLSLADVYAALTYYWDHRNDIEERIKADNALIEELRQEN